MRANHPTRRTFVKRSAATLAAAAATQSYLAANAYAGGGDTLKVGLIGRGGRGTGAAEQALNADKKVKLVAMGDAFKDRLDESLSTLQGSAVADRVDVPPDRQYVGGDASKPVIDQVDVALLITPPTSGRCTSPTRSRRASTRSSRSPSRPTRPASGPS